MKYTLYLSQLLVLCTLPSIHRSTQFVWFIIAGYPCRSSHPLPMLLELEPLFPTNSPCGYHARCGRVLMVGYLPSSSTVSPHHDRVNFETHSTGVMEWVWKYTWRLWSSEFGDALGGHDCTNLEDVIKQVWRCTWRLRSSVFGDELGDRDRASLERHFEAVFMQTRRL